MRKINTQGIFTYGASPEVQTAIENLWLAIHQQGNALPANAPSYEVAFRLTFSANQSWTFQQTCPPVRVRTFAV
jgi:putative flippase GtrA